MTKFSVHVTVSSMLIVILCLVQVSLAFVVVVDTKHHAPKHRSLVVSTNTNTCAFRSLNANTKKNNLPLSISIGLRQSPSRSIIAHRHKLFGSFFDDGGGDKTIQKLDVDGQLALYPNVANGAKFQSLSDYLVNQWAKLFESGTIKLTTPVRVLPMSSSPGNYDATVIAINGVRLVFQNTNTGYKSKKDEQEQEQETRTENYDTKKKPDKQDKQGGVEILIELVGTATDGSEDDNDSESLQVRVRAQRCDWEEDTMIKEMSEEVILKELRDAIEIWKREASA